MPTAGTVRTMARISAFKAGPSAPLLLTPIASARKRPVKTCFDANISERISNCDVRFYIIARTRRGTASQAGFQTFDGGGNFPSDTIHRSFSRIG
jgi:hypothetical protein